MHVPVFQQRSRIAAVAAGLAILHAAIPWLDAQQRPEPDERSREVARVVQDASRALQSGSPALFLRLFDRKRLERFAALESHIVALFGQSDIASSIEIAEMRASEDGYDLRVDWVLQLTLQETAAPVENRREVIKLRIAPADNGRMRIAGLEPVDFFRPQSARVGPAASR